MWGPPVISWFINPINYSYLRIINHSYWSYVHQLSYRTGPHIVVKLTNIDQLVHQSMGRSGGNLWWWISTAGRWLLQWQPTQILKRLWARVDQSHGRKSFQVSFEGGLSTQHCDFHAENDDKPSKFEVPYFKINSSFSEEISFRNLLQKTSMTLEVLQQDLRN